VIELTDLNPGRILKFLWIINYPRKQNIKYYLIKQRSEKIELENRKNSIPNIKRNMST